MLMTERIVLNQAGWSLPLTWIFLIILGVLIYFWGWIVILFVLAACGAITLGTYIYDKIIDSPSG
jgi:peptidoglycan/LPS O-acetylase OafA/YrhL